MYLNTNLSFLRKKYGLTQGEMAEIIGLTQSAVGLYESGDREPSLKNLIKIAEYFSVSIDDLLLKDLRPQGSMLARNLKYLQNREHFSQGDMARLLKISKANMGKCESGAAELSNQGLINVSEFFGITVDDLLKKDLRLQGSMLARNLKYLQNREHFSQGDMARLLKISKANMGKYESGAAELSNQGLINVSEFFGITVDDLLKKDLSKEGFK